MALDAIQNRLNQEFSHYSQEDQYNRRIIFWFDSNRQYESEIDSLKLSNAILYKLDGKNYFKTKYLLEKEDTNHNYLIYAPFGKPVDSANILADIIYYSKIFAAERVDSVCVDLGIGESEKQYLKQFSKFWNDENEQKFKEICVQPYTIDNLRLATLAVAVDSQVAVFPEIFKKILIDSYKNKEQEKLKALSSFGLTNLFWEYVASYYGFNEKQDIKQCAGALFITYISAVIKKSLPEKYKKYVLTRSNNVNADLTNMMNDSSIRITFNQISKDIESIFKIEELASSMNIEDYDECYIFEVFDKIICKELISNMIQTLKPLDRNQFEILVKRHKRTHFTESYGTIYRAINRASKYLTSVEEFEKDYLSAITADDVMRFYKEKWCNIDRYYRQFYFAFDQLNASEEMEKLRDMIENIYLNRYLNVLSKLWSEKIESIEDWGKINGMRQTRFFNLKLGSRGEKVCVIISDAFRYECSLELASVLKDQGCSVTVENMVSSLPSYTKLGMAALLPNNQNITFDDSWNVLVDGKSTIGTTNRMKILQTLNSDSVAIQYTDYSKMNRPQRTDFFKGKSKIAYIYHDKIDDTGEHRNSIDIFKACNEAIQDIKDIISTLKNDSMFSKFIVTADHGFIYRRDKLDASDKIKATGIPSDVDRDNRCIVSNQKLNLDATLSFNLGYLSPDMKDKYVTVPRGCFIFTTGGGQDYVHGGASLQEIVIPLLTIETSKGKAIIDTVSIELMPCDHKITNPNSYIQFKQAEAVTETLKQSKIKAVFVDCNDKSISSETEIIGDRTSINLQDRIFMEKFTFINQKYDKNANYYLLIKDSASGMEIKREKFIIDMPFVDDFGF